jgi:hypothetical protein
MMKSYQMLRVRVMVFNATFNNISAISWQSFLLVKDTGDIDQSDNNSKWELCVGVKKLSCVIETAIQSSLF